MLHEPSVWAKRISGILNTNILIAVYQNFFWHSQSKIKKRAWVLHECMERVPNDIDAMRELLQYGLIGTDLEALVKIGQGKDKGR